MQSVMNLKIKFRESFRPFAPVVLRERAEEYFEMSGGTESPTCCWSRLSPRTAVAGRWGGGRRARQAQDHPLDDSGHHARRLLGAGPDRGRATATRFHRLLKAFDDRTGCPVLINTSFNVRGEPIVCTPEDAYRCFMATDMDVLVLENPVLRK